MIDKNLEVFGKQDLLKVIKQFSIEKYKYLEDGVVDCYFLNEKEKVLAVNFVAEFYRTFFLKDKNSYISLLKYFNIKNIVCNVDYEKVLKDNNKKYDVDCDHNLEIKKIEIKTNNNSFLTLAFILINLPYTKIENSFLEKTVLVKDEYVKFYIKTGDNFNIPYGKYARFLLFYIVEHIKRFNTTTIKINHKLPYQEFLKQFKIKANKNLCTMKQKLLEQLHNLLNSSFEVVFYNKDFILQHRFYLTKKNFYNKEDGSITSFEVSTDFLEYVNSNNVIPFNTQAVNKLGASSQAIDLYIYFNYQSYLASTYRKDFFISYDDLYQLYSQDKNKSQFICSLKKHIAKIVNINKNLHIALDSKKYDIKGLFVLKTSKSNSYGIHQHNYSLSLD